MCLAVRQMKKYKVIYRSSRSMMRRTVTMMVGSMRTEIIVLCRISHSCLLSRSIGRSMSAKYLSTSCAQSQHHSLSVSDSAVSVSAINIIIFITIIITSVTKCIDFSPVAVCLSDEKITHKITKRCWGNYWRLGHGISNSQILMASELQSAIKVPELRSKSESKSFLKIFYSLVQFKLSQCFLVIIMTMIINIISKLSLSRSHSIQ